MSEWITGAVFVGGLFAGMLLCLEAGRRARVRRAAREPGVKPGFGPVEGAVFALLGLLVTFTFSGAASRFDVRRHLIVEEANAIGTAYRRLDLLPAEPRAALQEKLRQYVDARLATYAALSKDTSKAQAELVRVRGLQDEIWARAVEAAGRVGGPQATTVLLPALNSVFDTGATHVASTRIHPPGVIFVLLAVVAFGCSLFAGFGMGGAGARSWLHILGFAAVISATVYVIVDLEYPRLGLIRVDAFDQVLVELRHTM